MSQNVTKADVEQNSPELCSYNDVSPQCHKLLPLSQLVAGLI